MRALSSFDYAVVRIVPRVDREEFINAGVILFCLEQSFLGAKVEVETERLLLLWPQSDADAVRAHLDAFVQVCLASADAGPVARLSQRERFHWLVSPRSTIIQVSAVHSGLCETLAPHLERLFRQLVQQEDS